MKNLRAFTLIELIITLVLVGILAIIALPRFSDLSEEAEVAQARGIAANFRSSVGIVKSVFLSQDHTRRVQNLQGFGNNNVDTNNLGYPIGINKGNSNENIGVGSAGCVGVWNGILSSPPTVANNNNNQSYRSYRHTGRKVCSYVYRDNGDTGNRNTGRIIIQYDSRDGTVKVCGASSLLPAC